MLNKKLTTMYKKSMQYLVEVQEDVIASKQVSMEDRIKFVTFMEKVKATINNKLESENTVVNAETSENEVITNE